MNIGLQPSARTDVAGGLDPAIEAGAVGLKIHEDWGAYPEIIDATLRAADAHDIAVCLHTDSLNESTELEGTVEAIAGRTIHAYHVEGSGGGHIPDALGLVREPNVVLFLDDADAPLRTGDGVGAARHEADRPRGEPVPARGRGGGARSSCIPRRWPRRGRSTSSARSRS